MNRAWRFGLALGGGLIVYAAQSEAAEPVVSADDIVASLGASIFDDQTRALSDAEKPSVMLRVEFDLGRAELTEAGRQQLDELAAALARPAGSMDKGIFRIEGHTDSLGADDYNLRLSKERAEAVVAYLTEAHAVDPARLEVEGYGETRPATPDDTEAAINRRVEVRRLGNVP